jgi:hypothetical protein
MDGDVREPDDSDGHGHLRAAIARTERSTTMNRLRAFVHGMMLMVAVALVTPEEAPAQFTPTVTPLLYCKVTNEANHSMDIYWGYASSHAEPVTIPAGGLVTYPDPGLYNIFFPDPFDRSQPTTFLPGVHPRVFVTTVSGISPTAEQLFWLVDGNFAGTHAFRASDECTHPFALDGPAGLPGPAGPVGPAGPPGPDATVRRVVANGRQSSAVAACNADEALVSGGGSCATWILESRPSGNSWSVKCKGKASTTATALCIRR